MSRKTVASNPGCVKVSFFTVMKGEKILLSLFLITLIIASILFFIFNNADIKKNFYFFVPAIIFLYLSIDSLSEKMSKFKEGDANPGVVIALDPTRIAVLANLANLANAGDFYPVFKIIQEKSMKEARLNDKVATVAFYLGTFDKPYWNNVEPEAVQGVNPDIEVEKKVLETFSQDQWDFIAENIHQIPEDFSSCGLYKIKNDYSDWE